MKLKQYIAAASLLALMGLPAGCSKEEAMDNGKGTEVPSAGIRQLVFNFGGLRLPDGVSTRAEAIATQAETEVESLIILLAGVDDETHTNGKAAVVYEYRASWATEPTETDNYKKLILQQNGNLLTGTLYVDENVMLPEYLSKKALVLVNGVKVRLTDASGTARDIATGSAFADIATATPEDIYRMCGGLADGQGFADGTRMELAWGPADLTKADIACPLPMSATINRIDFHGSTNLNVQLKRHVSRFDLRNGQTAQLRVGSIRPLSATTGIEFDDATQQTRVDMQDQSFVPAQNPGTDWENVPAEVAPAFYTFPSALHQGKQMMKLRVTAKKLNGTSGAWEDKTYTLNLANADKQPISIDANTRYVINISEVTDLNITASITIADWQQGGDVDGDLNPNPASRKAPTLQGLNDDADKGITWTLADSGQPTALEFAKAYISLEATFITPAKQDVADGSDADQPQVSIDIFREDGVADGVWLEASEGPVTRNATGDVLHKLKIIDITGNTYPPLWVKVKNHFFPEKFVMFRVTGVDSGKIVIGTDGDNPVDVPDGWKTDPDNDVFEEGTVIAPPAPIYGTNAVYSVNGYWVTAPGAENATYVWNSDKTATSMEKDPCAAAGKGWSMPTMKDFEKMLGWTERWPWSDTPAVYGERTILSNADQCYAAFAGGDLFFSSNPLISSEAEVWGIKVVNPNTAKYTSGSKGAARSIRCVQKQ